MEVKRAALVLADISGYTRFMRVHPMSLLHAEAIITELWNYFVVGIASNVAASVQGQLQRKG